jgi:hypothetical protein
MQHQSGNYGFRAKESINGLPAFEPSSIQTISVLAFEPTAIKTNLFSNGYTIFSQHKNTKANGTSAPNYAHDALK